MVTVFERIKQYSLDQMAEHYAQLNKSLYEGARMALIKKGFDVPEYIEDKPIAALKEWLSQEAVDLEWEIKNEDTENTTL